MVKCFKNIIKDYLTIIFEHRCIFFKYWYFDFLKNSKMTIVLIINY